VTASVIVCLALRLKIKTTHTAHKQAIFQVKNFRYAPRALVKLRVFVVKMVVSLILRHEQATTLTTLISAVFSFEYFRFALFPPHKTCKTTWRCNEFCTSLQNMEIISTWDWLETEFELYWWTWQCGLVQNETWRVSMYFRGHFFTSFEMNAICFTA